MWLPSFCTTHLLLPFFADIIPIGYFSHFIKRSVLYFVPRSVFFPSNRTINQFGRDTLLCVAPNSMMHRHSFFFSSLFNTRAWNRKTKKWTSLTLLAAFPRVRDLFFLCNVCNHFYNYLQLWLTVCIRCRREREREQIYARSIPPWWFDNGG